jgi:hypothetical protein
LGFGVERIGKRAEVIECERDREFDFECRERDFLEKVERGGEYGGVQNAIGDDGDNPSNS